MIERAGVIHRRSATIPLLIAVATMAGCLFGHPIVEPQEDLDLPPIVLEIEPPNDEPIQIDRSQALRRTFSLEEIVDPNLGDRIELVVTELVVVEGRPEQQTLSPRGATLTPSLVQERSNVTTYDAVTQAIDPCDAFHKNETLQAIEIRMTLVDRVPDSQLERFGEPDHIVEVSWFVLLEGRCPAGNE